MDIILKTDLLFTAVDEKVREGFVAIKGNKIAKVGALEEASAYIEEGTRVYDLTGQVIAPGFVDNYVAKPERRHLWRRIGRRAFGEDSRGGG